jgi:hypothetical protein
MDISCEISAGFPCAMARIICLVTRLGNQLICDETMAAKSSGGVAEPAVRLEIALRILHGASYHDLVMFYKISTATVYNIFHDVVDAIV